MNELYKNRDWLYEQYWGKEKSQRDIAKECKKCQYVISYWMKKLNIPVFSASKSIHLAQAKHCHLTQKAKEWLNGELLGDGSLLSTSIFSAGFQYGSKYKEYIYYIKNTLKSFGIEQIGKIYKYSTFNKFYYNYHSRRYVELLPVREKWYPNGKKIVPKDIELVPLTCRQWYIGDGYINRNGKNPFIILATDGFLVSDVNWLVDQLNVLGFKTKKQACRNAIYISTYSTKDFLDYIGKCPVECYKYKWKQEKRRN